jgi:hypothetical protein
MFFFQFKNPFFVGYNQIPAKLICIPFESLEAALQHATVN